MALNRTQKQWTPSHLILIGLLTLAAWVFFDVAGRPLAVSVLDVGQGDAILIQTPEFKNILIDTGPDSTVVDRLGEKLGFFQKSLDLVVLTHPDQDHIGGFLDVLEKYQVKTVMLTDVQAPSQLYQTTRDNLKTKNIPIIIPTSDQDLELGQNVYLDVIFPLEGQSFPDKTVPSANNTSIIARLRRWTGEHWENLVLLPGDAERSQETEILLSGQDLDAQILKLGHHGSKTSTSEPWLKAVSPKTAIISAGRENRFGHPHVEVLERVRDLRVRRTDKEGTVSLSFP